MKYHDQMSELYQTNFFCKEWMRESIRFTTDAALGTHIYVQGWVNKLPSTYRKEVGEIAHSVLKGFQGPDKPVQATPETLESYIDALREEIAGTVTPYKDRKEE